jgi:homospermidine synthase
MKIDIKRKKIVFLGYGAVAKCVWNYFNDFFIYSKKNVFLIDKNKNSFYGPGLETIKKIVLNVDATTFDDLVDYLHLKKGDIIIDLTTSTITYYFIKKCLLSGYYYINTSIEDIDDKMEGQSIDCQHERLKEICRDIKPTSTVLTECGQNPGLIQHYVLYALNQLSLKKDYKKKTLQKVIDEYQIGSILMSEIDNMKEKKETIKDKKILYNTWSVSGYLFESLDNTELVCGKTNSYIKPFIDSSKLNKFKMDIYKSDKLDRNVIFLNNIALNSTLNSICPILDNNGQIEFKNYRGKLIHHGEVFELARYFGKNAPFMSYVYKNSSYMDESIEQFYKNYPNSSEDDLLLYIEQNDTFYVFDNMKGSKMIGHDSVGCTIFCGKDKVERIFWCGSILSDTDKNVKPEFTPTIIQVAAGVLSGLSFIIENKNMGWVEPCDLNTKYILEKSIPLLGKFMFLEIPVKEFSGKFDLQ